MLHLVKYLSHRLVRERQLIPRTAVEAINRHTAVKYLCIVGLPRSGTSLFQRFMNTFDEVLVSYESTFRPLFRISRKRDVVLYFYDILKQSKQFYELQNSSSRTKVKPQLFEHTYDYLGDKTIFGESALFQKQLRNAIRSENFWAIFILRHPFDRFLSVVNWRKKRNLVLKNSDIEPTDDLIGLLRHELKRWNCFSSFVTELTKRKPAQTLLIKYEDLVDSPEEVARRIATFLNVSMSQQILDFSQSVKPNHSSRNSRNEFGWAEEIIETECSDFLKTFYA